MYPTVDIYGRVDVPRYFIRQLRGRSCRCRYVWMRKRDGSESGGNDRGGVLPGLPNLFGGWAFLLACISQLCIRSIVNRGG